MKIIQVISNITGSGASLYFLTLHRALRELGHNVSIYQFSNMDSLSFKMDNVNFYHKEFSQETYDEMNSADYVFIEGLPNNKEPQEYKDAYLDMLLYEVKVKKALFMHSHIYMAWCHSNYGKRIISKEFLFAMDKICSFCLENAVLRKMAKVIGEDELKQRFVHFLHPYYFDKSLWLDKSEKQRKISYFGRLVRFKDPERFIESRDILWNNNWQMEMRGVVRSIGALGFKNFTNKWDYENNKPTNEKSDVTCFLTGQLKENYGLDKNDKLCIDLKSNDRKIFSFGRYDYNDGIEVMRHHAFGVDFYCLTNEAYGDNTEYAIFDFVKAGTIPVIDTDMAKLVHIYKDGVRSSDSLYSLKAGIFVNKDLSNLEEATKQMNYLFENLDEYDKFRENCYNVYKQMTDPIETTKYLLNGLLK